MKTYYDKFLLEDDNGLGNHNDGSHFAFIPVFTIGFSIYEIYQRYFSDAAKHCKHESGSKKTICIEKMKMLAVSKTMVEANRKLSECHKTKNPEECKRKVKEKIEKFKNNVAYGKHGLRNKE